MHMPFDLQGFYKELDACFTSGDGRRIRTFLEDAWQSAQRLEDTRAQIAVANELGGWYRAQGHLQEAKSLYQKALRDLDADGQRQTENYATTLINAGDVYIVDKQYDTPIAMFLEAESILVHLGLQNDYRMAALKNNISAAYREQGEFPRAEMALVKALDVLTHYPEQKSERATTLINLAQLQMKQGKFAEATDHLLQCMAIYRAMPGERDPHVAMALAALGEVYYYQGNYTEAENYYSQALAAVEALFGRSPVYDSVAANLERVRKLRMG